MTLENERDAMREYMNNFHGMFYQPSHDHYNHQPMIMLSDNVAITGTAIRCEKCGGEAVKTFGEQHRCKSCNHLTFHRDDSDNL